MSHELLLARLNIEFGVTGSALEWIRSYLDNRTQSVVIADDASAPVHLKCGVPQGSVLGPDFSDYSSPISSIICSHGISVHCYADDTQLYASFRPGQTENAVLKKMEQCIVELREWMDSNKLKLNDSKTEFVIFGSAARLSKVTTESISIGDERIPASSSVRNIGAYMDSRLKMEVHVTTMCRAAWFHLFRIGKIRRYLTRDQAKSVIHAYVTSKLDSNNALLTGSPSVLTRKLQRIQNAAARLITGAKKGDHVTPILKSLHWLPIHLRILFKLLLLTFKALNDAGPAYLKVLLDPYQPHRALRSSSDPLRLSIPVTRLMTYGDRSFSHAAPMQWNRLPANVRSCTTVASFKIALKTFLFKSYYM